MGVAPSGSMTAWFGSLSCRAANPRPGPVVVTAGLMVLVFRNFNHRPISQRPMKTSAQSCRNCPVLNGSPADVACSRRHFVHDGGLYALGHFRRLRDPRRWPTDSSISSSAPPAGDAAATCFGAPA